GNFTLDANRQLVNSDGMFVLDVGGAPIMLEDTITAFSISQDGTIVGVTVDGQVEAGQIGVVRVVNPGGLEKLGGNLYRMTMNANPDGEIEILAPNDAEVGT